MSLIKNTACISDWKMCARSQHKKSQSDNAPHLAPPHFSGIHLSRPQVRPQVRHHLEAKCVPQLAPLLRQVLRHVLRQAPIRVTTAWSYRCSQVRPQVRRPNIRRRTRRCRVALCAFIAAQDRPHHALQGPLAPHE